MNHIKINWENIGTNYNTHIKIIALFNNFEIAKLTVNSYEPIIVDKKIFEKTEKRTHFAFLFFQHSIAISVKQ